MIETLTIITLCISYLIFFRPGKTPPLDNPLVIERAGQFHLTLAPKLNLAQPFIEAVAKRLASSEGVQEDSATLYFEVSDKQVKAHGSTSYLLALTWRNRMLYCQAASPSGKKTEDDLKIIQQAAGMAMSSVASAVEQGRAGDERVIAAVNEIVQLRDVEIKQIASPSP